MERPHFKVAHDPAGVTDQLWSVEDLVVLWEAYEQRRAEERRSAKREGKMVYLKSVLAGIAAVVIVAVASLFVGVAYLSLVYRRAGSGEIGWDPISLAKPGTWLLFVIAIFLAGFFLGVSSCHFKAAHNK